MFHSLIASRCHLALALSQSQFVLTSGAATPHRWHRTKPHLFPCNESHSRRYSFEPQNGQGSGAGKEKPLWWWAAGLQRFTREAETKNRERTTPKGSCLCSSSQPSRWGATPAGSESKVAPGKERVKRCPCCTVVGRGVVWPCTLTGACDFLMFAVDPGLAPGFFMPPSPGGRSPCPGAAASAPVTSGAGLPRR